MGLTLAKILIDLPECYRYLLDSKLTFIAGEEYISCETAPVVPTLSLTFYRTEKNDSRAD